MVRPTGDQCSWARFFFLAEMVQPMERKRWRLGARGDGVNSKALGRRGALWLLRWKDERKEKMEVSDSDIGRLREWYSYQRPWSRESRSISKAEAGRSVAWMDNGKSLDQLLWNTGGSTQRRLEGLSGSRRASLMFPNIDLPFEKSHSHGSVDFPQPHLALQVQKPSKWTVGSTPA